MTTIAHLNSHEVYLYLYQLLNKVERQLSHLLSKYKYNQVSVVVKRSKDRWKKSRLKEYAKNKKSGLERYWYEYISIEDLKYVLAEFDMYSDLGYKIKKDFNDDMDKLITVRNIIAHPSNNIIHKPSSISDVNNFIIVSEKLLKHL